MVIIKWRHELELGIPLIDQQHREIVESANRFFIRRKCGQDKSAAAECLAFLQQYIMYHFQAEEAFQLDCGFPDYQHHCAIHKSIATQVKFLAVKAEASNYAEHACEAFYQFLTEWIQDHILREDLCFANYYRDKQAEP